jgi:hypothetical protein
MAVRKKEEARSWEGGKWTYFLEYKKQVLDLIMV